MRKPELKPELPAAVTVRSLRLWLLICWQDECAAGELVAARIRQPYATLSMCVCLFVDVCKGRAHKSWQQSPIKVGPCSECTNRWNLPQQAGRVPQEGADALTSRRNASDLIVRWICLKVCGLFASAAFVIAKSCGSFDSLKNQNESLLSAALGLEYVYNKNKQILTE